MNRAVIYRESQRIRHLSRQYASQYVKLMEPLQLGHVTLKNRVLMGSMHTGLEEAGGFLFPKQLDEMAAFYAERAKGEVGLIVTGGISPNEAGKGYFGAAKMSTLAESKRHNIVTDAVHSNGGKIAMQILHSGRYAYHPWLVSSSPLKAPIGWFTPKALSTIEVTKTIDDFVKCAELAKKAGYDGVEIMGSEGYLINQFLVNRTNKRTDEWGGTYENRMRLPIEIVKNIRKATGKDFIVIYRLSMIDLVEDGSSWSQVVMLAKKIEEAGASIINTGIGWHEARIPTIATMVPRGAFTWVTKKLKGEVSIPLCTTNRINLPQTAEDILASGCADMISMARPFLADPHFVKKAMQNKSDEINTCIGCNQACLDHIFVNKRASCLVNPKAAHETKLLTKPVEQDKILNIAVIGAGPAGLSFSVTAAERGHKVTLFDRDDKIGGQFNLAKSIPGKEEFNETLRYFNKQLELKKVELKLNTLVTEELLLNNNNFDAVVVATGVSPRKVKIPIKTNKIKIVSYVELLKNCGNDEYLKKLGKKIAIIGAGGIGFDVADFLTHYLQHEIKHNNENKVNSDKNDVGNEKIKEFLKDWKIDENITQGGLLSKANYKNNNNNNTDNKTNNKTINNNNTETTATSQVYLLQRKNGKLGSSLGKTTGWIHRTTMKKRNVIELSGCNYVEVNDDGFLIEIDNDDKKNTNKNDENKKTQKNLNVDSIVICAGQESLNNLFEPLIKNEEKIKKKVFLIGGAQAAGEYILFINFFIAFINDITVCNFLRFCFNLQYSFILDINNA
jgi:2,4-dienoyl-CoA reductase (NADPH2)